MEKLLMVCVIESLEKFQEKSLEKYLEKSLEEFLAESLVEFSDGVLKAFQ